MFTNKLKKQLVFSLPGILFFAAACGPQALPETPDETQPAEEQPLAPATNRSETKLDSIADRYVVVLREGRDAPSVAEALSIQPDSVYRWAIRGFSASLSAAQVAALKKNPDVVLVERVQIYSTNAVQRMDSAGEPWGLDRIDQRTLPLSKTYSYTKTGTGVRAYVIDTGIDSTHPELRGRAMAVYDAFGGDGKDCHGHGTHVAGTIGGTTHGVAKEALLRGVRIFDCDGNTTTDKILQAIDWVAKNRIRPAVANMSFGGPRSEAMNTAVNKLMDAGVFVAVAAGNGGRSGELACDVSPASTPNAVTVGAVDRYDNRADFSDSGACVDLYAPGVKVRSTIPGGGLAMLDGTSMAAPHVTGIAALYKSSRGDASQSAIGTWLVTQATAGAVRGNPPMTPNRLLFKSDL